MTIRKYLTMKNKILTTILAMAAASALNCGGSVANPEKKENETKMAANSVPTNSNTTRPPDSDRLGNANKPPKADLDDTRTPNANSNSPNRRDDNDADDVNKNTRRDDRRNPDRDGDDDDR